MGDVPNLESEDILLRIQNSRKPDQVIDVVPGEECFQTQGLKELFGQAEIKIDPMSMLQYLEQYAAVLAFLLETISEAQDLNLPYSYQDHFEYAGDIFTIHKEGEYRRLQRVEKESGFA